MKQVYGNVLMINGAIKPGIVKIEIVPKQFVAAPIIRDFNSNSVQSTINLLPGKNWMVLEFIPGSYDFEEKPKQSKSGESIQTTVQGLLNNVTADNLQIIESFRTCEVVALVTDKYRNKRVCGNELYGMFFGFSHKSSSANGGTIKPEITLTWESEYYSPYYLL